LEQFFPKEKIMVTGNPVRKNISSSTYTRDIALMQFGLLPQRKTVLIVGGSLGANSINDVIMQNLQHFNDQDLQLIWQTGKSQSAKYLNAAKSFSNVYVNSFLDDMSAAYMAADIVVSRAGAMSVAEIALTGKPCVFVPYPFAAEDHQTFNAMSLVNEGAALIVADKEVNEKLMNAVMNLVQDEALSNQIHSKIKNFGTLNADKIIAEYIIQNVQEN
jgi:UDP-N-acetylglucosamine--N-acetylmuramyl-(pentapeptide) pyrophosphoryl-undecaprenol N-acetylglucosamine transferase